MSNKPTLLRQGCEWTKSEEREGNWILFCDGQRINRVAIPKQAANEILSEHNAALAALQQDLKAALDRRAEAVEQLAAERCDWTELRDLLHLTSTDNDKAAVIREIKQLATVIHEIK